MVEPHLDVCVEAPNASHIHDLRDTQRSVLKTGLRNLIMQICVCYKLHVMPRSYQHELPHSRHFKAWLTANN